MKAVFVETTGFTRWVAAFLTEEAYAELQLELMDDPQQGAVMPGCGGLRKLRVADVRRGKGKRSGARIIYLHVPEVNQILLLDIYGKGEQENLSAAEKRALSQLANEFRLQLQRGGQPRSRRRR